MNAHFNVTTFFDFSVLCTTYVFSYVPPLRCGFRKFGEVSLLLKMGAVENVIRPGCIGGNIAEKLPHFDELRGTADGTNHRPAAAVLSLRVAGTVRPCASMPLGNYLPGGQRIIARVVEKEAVSLVLLPVNYICRIKVAGFKSSASPP